MIYMQNTVENARLLFNMIKREKITPVFDLDEVLFCAKHRQALFSQEHVDAGLCKQDQIGQLDLVHYRDNTTAEAVALDQNLELIKCVHMLNDANICYHVATARVACEHTRALLQARGVRPQLIISRDSDQDHRKDHDLKVQGIEKHFPKCTRSKLMIIDDNLANCNALAAIGLMAIRVVARGTLNIRTLI